MSWIERELKELRQLNADFDTGKINIEKALIKIAIYNQTQKRLGLLLRAHTLQIKGQIIPLVANSELHITSNPCFSCDLKDKDKNNDRCKNCDLRIAYLRQIETEG